MNAKFDVSNYCSVVLLILTAIKVVAKKVMFSSLT